MKKLIPRTLICLSILLFGLTLSAQTKQFDAYNDQGGVNITIVVKGIDPSNSQLYYAVVKNNGTDDIKISFSYAINLTCGSVKSGSLTTEVPAGKTVNFGEYNGSFNAKTECGVTSGNAALSASVSNVSLIKPKLGKIQSYIDNAYSKMNNGDFAAAKGYLDNASQLCNSCSLQNQISNARAQLIELKNSAEAAARNEKIKQQQEQKEAEKKQREQEQIESEKNKREQEAEQERLSKEQNPNDNQSESESTVNQTEAAKTAGSDSSTGKPLIQKTADSKNATETDNKKVEETTTIDYYRVGKYKLKLKYGYVMSYKNDSNYMYNLNSVTIDGMSFYNYVDYVITECDNFMNMYGADDEVQYLRNELNKITPSYQMAESAVSLMSASTRWELVGSLGLQPTSLIENNPDTLYETYNLELRFLFLPGWFKFMLGGGLGIMDFPDASFAAYSGGQPAYTDKTKLSFDSEIKFFRGVAGFQERFALNDDATIHLSFEQIYKYNFMQIGDKEAYTDSTIKIPLDTRTTGTTDGKLLSNFSSAAAGVGFDFGFGGEFGMGIYGNVAYYFYGQKQHKGSFNAESEYSGYNTDYEFTATEAKLKQFISTISIKLFLDFE